jgi:hypothetical protein
MGKLLNVSTAKFNLCAYHQNVMLASSMIIDQDAKNL